MSPFRPILLAALLTPAAAADVTINFDFYPGGDGQLGTPDDIPIVAPSGFAGQSLQLSDQFFIVGVVFAVPPVNDRNEILNNTTFTVPPAATEPNLLASAGTNTIEFSFFVTVTSVSALIGISGGTDRMTIYDAGGAVLGTAVGDDAVVTLGSGQLIKRVVISAESGTTPTIDNLRFSGDACYADCNTDGQLTVQDFGCFQTAFVAGNMYADCTADGQLTVQDFGCYQTKFVAGCP